MPRLPHPLVLAAASGALIACAYPVFGQGWGFGHLAWVALVPLLVALHRQSPRQAAATGAVTGGVFGLLAFTWIVGAMQLHFQSGWLLSLGTWVAHALTLAGMWALFGAGLARLRTVGVSPLLSAPALLVVLEAFLPRVFPGPLSATLYLDPAWLQLSDALGAVGVSGVVAAVNAGWALTLLRPPSRRTRPLLIAAVLLLGTRGYGALRMAQVDADVASAPTVSVGIAQPGVQAHKAEGQNAQRLAWLQDRSAELEARGAELILWPESGYRGSRLSRLAAGFMPQPVQARALAGEYAQVPQLGFTTPLLFQSMSAHPDQPDQPYNTAWLLDHQGRVALRYDKSQLVPFGEYTPFAEPLRAVMGPDFGIQGPTPGDALGIGELTLRSGRALRVGVFICYEAIQPALVAQLGAHEPELLLNVANDSLFGSAVEREQHLAMLLPRAIEQRRSMARAGLNGVSAFIDPAGRLLQAERADRPATLLQALPLVSTRSWPLGARALSLACLVFVLTGMARRR